MGIIKPSVFTVLLAKLAAGEATAFGENKEL
jgi:hypothetical protein